MGGRWGESVCAHLGHRRVALGRPIWWSGRQGRLREHPGAWRDEITVSGTHGSWQASRAIDGTVAHLTPTTSAAARRLSPPCAMQ